MNRSVQFRRNVYIIMISILALAILTQIARSQFVLQSNQNEKFVIEHQLLLSEWEQEGEVTLTSDTALTDEVYCLGYMASDEFSVKLKENVTRMLDYMKRYVRPIELSQEKVPYDSCTSLLLATGELAATGTVDEMSEFVYRGGGIMLMMRPEEGNFFDRLYRRLGIVDFHFANSTNGIRITSNVLIGEKGLELGHDFMVNTALRVDLDSESTLLAESLEGIPLMWKREYGDGAFIVFNGDSLSLKSHRGLIAGGISLLHPDYVYPIFNAKIFYIDDFPAPIKKGIDYRDYEKYGMDIPTFFKEIWWPDMLKAAKRYDLIYTAVAIQTYNDRVMPPFEDPIGEERHHLITFGREVIKSGGEIGIHGYNHQSLQMDENIAKLFGYKKWNSPDHMEESVEDVIKYMKSAFPKYTVMSYVPPSNVLGPEGRRVVKKAWPDLAVVASLYDTDYSNISYVQEFEIADDGVIEMPRVTSGYFEVPYFRWLEANVMTSLGYFSHFIHPDDLMDEARSRNESWDELYQDFSEFLERLDRTYPWLRDLTSIEAGLDVAKVLQSKVRIMHHPDRITGEVENFQSVLFYVLRTERKITKEDNCIVRKIDDNTYLLTVLDSKFAVGLGG